MTDSFSLIPATTVREWLNDGDELALFDVREAGEFGEGHPFFAIPLPYSRLELDVSRLAPRRDVRVVLLDDGANDEAIARRALSLLPAVDGPLPQGEPDIAVFTSGKPDFAISRLMQGFGLSVC